MLRTVPVARPTSGTTPARSTSSTTPSPAARPARPPTRASSSTCCAPTASVWTPRIREPCAASTRPGPRRDLTWAVVEAMAVRGAAVLAAGVRARGRPRRPAVAPDRPDALPSTPTGCSSRAAGSPRSAPNMQVKFPATRAGIAAIEAATARGHPHQRDGVLHGAPGAGRGRGGGARAGCLRGGRWRRGRDDPGVHADDGPARRLAAGRRPSATASRSIRTPWTGRGSPRSSAPTGCTGSAATAPGCSARPIATGCTGRSSSAATW